VAFKPALLHRQHILTALLRWGCVVTSGPGLPLPDRRPMAEGRLSNISRATDKARSCPLQPPGRGWW
jgi:hypothetical protein